MKLVHRMHQLMFMLSRDADTALQQNLSITYMQMMIIMISKTCPGISQRQITEKLQVTPGAISRQVDALHKKGWLIRETNKLNRREHNLTLTKQGEVVFNKSIALLESMLAPLFLTLSETKKKDTITNLETVIQKLHQKKNSNLCETVYSN